MNSSKINKYICIVIHDWDLTNDKSWMPCAQIACDVGKIFRFSSLDLCRLDCAAALSFSLFVTNLYLSRPHVRNVYRFLVSCVSTLISECFLFRSACVREAMK